MPTDAQRYQYLKEHCIRIMPADRDGPEYPMLSFTWGIFSWHKTKQDPKELIDKEIDKRMVASEEKGIHRSCAT